MAELFGTAASAVQIAEAGLSLATALYTYAQSVKGAEQDIKRVARDVRLLAKVLQQLHEQVQRDRDVRPCTEQAVQDLEEVLDGCKEAFEEVDSVLIKSNKSGIDGKIVMSMTEKLKWPLRSNKLAALRANLEKLKTTLLLMLSVLAYGSSMARNDSTAKKDELSLERLQIQNLIQAKQEAIQRMEELDKTETNTSTGTANSLSKSSTLNTSNARTQDLSRSSTVNTGLQSTKDVAPVNNQIALLAKPPLPSLPPVETTKPARPTRHRPTGEVGFKLELCASEVERLTDSIDAAMRKWESHQVLDRYSIICTLGDATEAINVLTAVQGDPNSTGTQSLLQGNKVIDKSQIAAQQAGKSNSWNMSTETPKPYPISPPKKTDPSSVQSVGFVTNGPIVHEKEGSRSRLRNSLRFINGESKNSPDYTKMNIPAESHRIPTSQGPIEEYEWSKDEFKILPIPVRQDHSSEDTRPGPVAPQAPIRQDYPIEYTGSGRLAPHAPVFQSPPPRDTQSGVYALQSYLSPGRPSEDTEVRPMQYAPIRMGQGSGHTGDVSFAQWEAHRLTGGKLSALEPKQPSVFTYDYWMENEQDIWAGRKHDAGSQMEGVSIGGQDEEDGSDDDDDDNKAVDDLLRRWVRIAE